ncbi:MAG: hypothetical protein ABT19_02765 [Rhodanobacter sp. SCN 68-63]|nr:MAG: hypothetical protein ABT19_02765 [Rhodanobacter sp. SCN 68-63]
MRSVDFLFFPDCPHAEQTRANLDAAFTAIASEPRWIEWDISDPSTPSEFRHYGSPTVLVNGRDVAGAAPMSGESGCRVYEAGDGLAGAPPVALLVGALRMAPAATVAAAAPLRGWRHVVAVLPSLGLAALPVGACPICVAGTVGVLSALGLGFLLDARFLMP